MGKGTGVLHRESRAGFSVLKTFLEASGKDLSECTGPEVSHAAAAFLGLKLKCI